MAQTLLAAVTKEIVTRLISFAAEEMRLARGFKREFNRLAKRFETAEALLFDAESRQIVKTKSVQGWLKKLETIAHDAEDVLEEFAFEVLRRRLEVQNRAMNKVRNFFSPSNKLAFRLKMARKVNDINSLLDEIYKEANEIGLKIVEIVNARVDLREVRQTHPFFDDSTIVGRDGDVSIIVDKLLSSDKEEVLPVISIVGMAGLGKTTLAQLVYKDEKVVRNFGERMWVCVSDDFSVQRLLNEMVQSLTGTTSEMSNMEAIVKRLQEKLGGKRYLLVLDDVWNEIPEKWENMRNSLLGIGGSGGSRIIITTRSMVVASTMHTFYTHRLGGLLEDDSWTLFKQRAFAKGGPKETPNLVDVGQRIVKRCGGVPLAIKTLGGLMHSKMNEHDWLSIERSEIWNSSEEINGTDIFPSLRLSFDHLPSPSLRQCFAYCSLFPKDYYIQRNNLIELWMAQGFLQPTKGSIMLMEDIGNNYFDCLLWNSLLQDVEKDEYGNVIGCKMHDLVHDFAVYISNNYCLTLRATEVNEVSEVQHISLISSKGEAPQFSKGSSKKLRTLYSIGNPIGDLLTGIAFLRVLKLYNSGIQKLSISISKMIHLRYLDISSTPIKVLPNFISKLYNLQTLKILYCFYLEELPREFKKLINLRHFYMDDDEKHRNLMPTGIGQLTCLQTLPFFTVGQAEGRKIEELGCLSNLRGAVKIYGLEHVTSQEDAQKANLSINPNIQELRFHWSSGREDNINMNEDEAVLEGLKPHSNLKGLVVENFGGGKVASWMMVMDHTLLLYNLVKMELKYCKKLEQIPALGKLPSLKVLNIEGMHNVKHIGTEFYGCNNPDGGSKTVVFPALRQLILGDMPILVQWCESNGISFPLLEDLYIKRCPQLIMAPSKFPSIKKLYAYDVNSVALKMMSSKLTSLTSLHLYYVSGSEIDFVLEEMFENNRSLLREITIYNCDRLTCLPKGIGYLASLESLFLSDCSNLMEIMPSDIRCLTSLRKLAIRRCGMLNASNCWPEWLFSLTPSLTRLEIGSFSEELDYFPWPPMTSTTTTSASTSTNVSSSSNSSSMIITEQGQQHHHHLFASLEDLALVGWPKLKFLPDQLQHLTALRELSIKEFDGLEALPDWLGNLSSLRYLDLWNCKNLMNLPSVEVMQRLTNLVTLEIDGCPLLKERCKKGSGPEWHKISHIPYIR